jgi:glyoxylase I family protein
MFLGFEHPGIAACDPKMLAEWYVRMFGFKVVFDNGLTPATYLLKTPDGGILEILPATSGESCDYGQQQAGIRHLALTVDDFEGALKALQDKGITDFFDDRRSESYKLIFFRDPEGNLLHLMWRPKPL